MIIKTGIQVEQDLWKKFKIAAAIEGKSGRELIDNCIRQYLERNHEYLMRDLALK